MSKAEEAALKAYPKTYAEATLSDGQTVFFERREDVRRIFMQGYELAQKDIAKALLAIYKEESDKCPDADYDHDYTVAETQQYGRFMMMESIYEKFCEPVGVTLEEMEAEK